MPATTSTRPATAWTRPRASVMGRRSTTRARAPMRAAPGSAPERASSGSEVRSAVSSCVGCSTAWMPKGGCCGSRRVRSRWAQHLVRLRAAGYPTDGSAYAFPDSRGNRSTRQRIALPETTPHTLRRTYIYLDRPGRQPLRRQVGDGPGRPRRLEDDDGRLRAARAARRPLARHPVRRPPEGRQAPSRGH
jgi:hypothetical protein